MIEKFYTGEELAAIAYLRENPDLAAKIVELVKTTPLDPTANALKTDSSPSGPLNRF